MAVLILRKLAVLCLLAWVVASFCIVEPCQALVLNRPKNEHVPSISNTISIDKLAPTKTAFQTNPSLSVSITINDGKKACLLGENVSISINAKIETSEDTRVDSIMVLIEAQLESGAKIEVKKETITGSSTCSRIYRWSAPPSPGIVRMSCYAKAKTRKRTSSCLWIWTSGKLVCIPFEDWEQNPDSEDTDICEFRVFDPVSPISGIVTDSKQKPIVGAIVRLSSTSKNTTTDRQGRYAFPSYKIGANYQLTDNIPTATETISIEAIACQPESKTINVSASQGVSSLRFTLERYFHPPAIEPSLFTFDTFPAWEDAKNYSTWQNILGITCEGSIELQRILLEGKKVSYRTFPIDNTRKLCLICEPRIGSYFLELQGKETGTYNVTIGATLKSSAMDEVAVSHEIKVGESHIFRLTIDKDRMKLQYVPGVSRLLLIIAGTIGLACGISLAYFLATGKLPALQKVAQIRRRKESASNSGGKSS